MHAALRALAGATEAEVYALGACWRFPGDQRRISRDVIAGAIRFGRLDPQAFLDVIEVLQALPDEPEPAA